MFSNKAAFLTFEASPHGVRRIASLLIAEEILNQESLDALAETVEKLAIEDEKAEIVSGTLNIAFVHDEPDLRIKHPSIPG